MDKEQQVVGVVFYRYDLADAIIEVLANTISLLVKTLDACM